MNADSVAVAASKRVFDVTVVGAGISGLVAAHRLKLSGLDVLLIDAGARAGGVIGSVARDGCLFERGPNSALDTTPLIGELVASLGLEGELRFASEAAEKRYVVRGGVLTALPDLARRVPVEPAVFALGQAGAAARAVPAPGRARCRGVDRGLRAAPPRRRIPRLRDRPLRRRHLCRRPRADLGARRVPEAARPRTTLGQPGPRPDLRCARAAAPEGDGEEQREELLIRRRHADPDRCAGGNDRRHRLAHARHPAGARCRWCLHTAGRAAGRRR